MIIPLIALILALPSGQAVVPESSVAVQVSVPVVQINVPVSVVTVKANVSRGLPEPRVERRVMKITAYTKNDPGMDGRGITTSSERVLEGRTIAADPSIPFGAQIHIPALGGTYTVTDRGGAIRGNRLDLYMEKRKDALEFGVQELEVLIRY